MLYFLLNSLFIFMNAVFIFMNVPFIFRKTGADGCSTSLAKTQFPTEIPFRLRKSCIFAKSNDEKFMKNDSNAFGPTYLILLAVALFSCTSRTEAPKTESVGDDGENIEAESIEAPADSTIELDTLSPYWYNKNQTEVTFSDDGETLLRFPRVNVGGDYVVPSTVKYIFERAFENCHELRSVVVPATVEEIQMAAFDFCPKLERVVFHNHLRKLPFRCFVGCDNLKELHLSDTIPPKIDEDEDTEEGSLVFYFTEKTLNGCTLYVPTGSLRKYRNTYGWRKFKKIVEE